MSEGCAIMGALMYFLFPAGQKAQVDIMTGCKSIRVHPMTQPLYFIPRLYCSSLKFCTFSLKLKKNNNNTVTIIIHNSDQPPIIELYTEYPTPKISLTSVHSISEFSQKSIFFTFTILLRDGQIDLHTTPQ